MAISEQLRLKIEAARKRKEEQQKTAISPDTTPKYHIHDKLKVKREAQWQADTKAHNEAKAATATMSPAEKRQYMQDARYSKTQEEADRNTDKFSAEYFRGREDDFNTYVREEMMRIYGTEGEEAEEAHRNMYVPGSHLYNLESGRDAMKRNAERIEYDLKYRDKQAKYSEGGQAGANYAIGRMQQDSNEAWSWYLAEPTQANKRYAEGIDKTLEEYTIRNQDVLQRDASLPWVTEDLAQYVPQGVDQTLPTLIGAGVGYVFGAPKLGAMAGSGYYSYQNMRGAAFRELLKLGVDEETAKNLSDDEAMISGLVEMAGTGIDIASLGFNKLFSALGGKKVLSSAAQKVIGALAGYGINIVGEGEEERAQSFISIANQRRAEKGEDTGLLGLIGDTAKLFYDAATGNDPEAAAQAAEEAAAGRRIAAMAGGGTLAVNTAVEAAVNPPVSPAVAREIALEEKARAKYASAQKKNPTATQEAATPLRMPVDETSAGQADYTATAPLVRNPAQSEEQAAYSQYTSDMGTAQAVKQQETSAGRRQLEVKRIADAKSVEEAADIVQRVQSSDPVTLVETIGERGAVAIENTRAERQQVGNETFTPAFAQYYRAGMLAKNAPFSALQNQLGTEMSTAAQEAAYEAGRADAVRIKEAAYFGKNSGLVRDVEYYKAWIDEKKTRQLDALGKILGVQIKFKQQVTAGGKAANASLSNGTMYIARDSSDPVMVAAVHEAVHRIRQTDPEAYNAINNSLWDLVGDDFPSVRSKIEELKTRYGVTSQDFAEEEYTAQAIGIILNDGKVLDKFVEKNPTGVRKVLAAIKDTITKIKNFIKKNALGLDKVQMEGFEAIQKDASKIEAAFESALERQKQRAEEVAEKAEQAKEKASTDGGETRYSISENFLAQLKKWLSGQMQKGDYFKLGITPDILIKHGAKALPIIMTQDVAIKITNGYHSISIDEIAMLPDQLSKPIMLFRGSEPGSIVVLTDMLDKNGDEVIAAIHLEKYQDRMRVNRIASLYGKRNIDDYVMKNVENDLLLYVDKNKGPAWFTSRGLQLPKLVQTITGFNDNVAQSETIVNTNISENVENDTEKYSLRYEQLLDEAGGETATAEDARKLLQANTILKERIAELKAQMKKTKAPTTDKKAVAQYVKQLLETESSTANADSVTDRLNSLYDYIAQGGEENDNLTWSNAKAQAREIAKDIVENASVLVRDTYEEYSDMRKFLRTTAVSISEKDKGDFRAGEFGELRKKNMGKLLITKDGTPIDVLWMELQERWPDMFPAEELTHNADMLRHMADVVNSLGQIYENPNEADLNSAIEYMADELLNNYFEMPQTKATFADRAEKKLIQQRGKDALKLEEVRAQRDERIAKILKDASAKREKMLKDVRDQRDQQIEKLKEKYAVKDQNRRERQTKTSLRGKIRRAVENLKKMTLRPTDTQHIPESLRSSVAAFIAEIDLSSDRMGADTIGKLWAAQRELAKIAKSDTGFAEIDPDLELNIETLEPVLKSKQLNEMTLSELDTLWQVTSAIQAAVTGYNRLFREGERQFVSELGKAAMTDLDTVKGYKDHALNGARWLADTLNMDMLAPADYFEQLGSTMNAFYAGIREGLDKKISHTKTAADYMRELIGEASIDEWSGKKAKSIEFELTSGKIRLTPAQVMSLYLLNRQEQAQKHMFEGGVKPASIVERRGKDLIPTVTKSYEVTKLQPEDVAKITGSLSEEQIRIAEGISKFFTEYTAEWGNEVSLQMYGYRKFTEENYFPIVSDKNYISQVYGETTDATLKNMGVTKARVAGANNPLIIEDVFDVYTRQADQMASYSAFVVPLTDIQKIWNYRSDSGSVKQFVEKKFGSRALAYFSKLITDINGGARVDRWSSGLGSLIGKYKAARVGWNLRVVIQQPTTYLRAAAMIDVKYLAQGAAMKPNWSRVLKYAPIAQWKDWGYFNLDTGKSMRDIFLNKKTLSDSTMWLAGKADQAAWSGLWNAAELEIADTRTDLEKGSDAFYLEVGKRFSEIIDRTQVVDSVLHRPQILRSNDGLTKMATAFMNEPMKAYNMLRTAARNAIELKTPEAKAKMARVAFAFAASVVLNSLAAALIDALRDDEDEGFWTRYLSAFTDNMIDAIPSMFPVLKDVFSLFSGYSVKRMDMAAIENLISAGRRAMSDKYTLAYKVIDVSSKVADLFGVPVSNIKRDASAIGGWLIRQAGNVEFEYQLQKVFSSINSSVNKSTFYDLAFRAYQSDDDTDFKRILKDMVANGYEEEAVYNAMYARVKKTPEFQKKYAAKYQAITNRLKALAYYKKLNEEAKASALELADKYAVSVVAEDAYEKEPTAWIRKAEAGAGAGVEPAEYILYKLALEMVDDGNNSITQAEAAAALELLALTEDEKEYIWQSQNPTWKASNNPYSDEYEPEGSRASSSGFTPRGSTSRSSSSGFTPRTSSSGSGVRRSFP